MNQSVKGITKLIYTNDGQEGYTRRRWGRGFSYLNWEGQRIKDAKIMNRIKSLVIPPAWEDVWICTLENGHLQSTGRDPKRRKQYIYHPDWTAFRQQKKFDKMANFAEQLPKIRIVTGQHLQDKDWTERKVLALIVRVLDECYIRIGNTQYKERNETYGLTTMRQKHMEIEKGKLTFSYKGKSNQYREVNIENKKLIRLIKSCSDLPGYEVFHYKTGSRASPVDSSEVNDYIQRTMGENFSSKDFRTWAGTSLAVKYADTAKIESETNTRKKVDSILVKKVSKDLGNTVSVCRDYYIHPNILKAVKADQLPNLENVPKRIKDKFKDALEDYEMIAYSVIC